MKREDFLKLSKLGKYHSLLHISDDVVYVLKNNQVIYSVVKNALTKAKDGDSILATELSIFLNHPDETQDLGMLVYGVNNLKGFAQRYN